jgi:hypothetical protein
MSAGIRLGWVPALTVTLGLWHVAGALGAPLGWSPEIPPGSTGGSAVRATAVACPSATQCTAVDSQGEEVTFNPQTPGSPEPSKLDWGNDLAGIACPSISQCTAVDNHGGQFTFDPAAPAAARSWPASAVSLFAVACVSLTECVGVGNPQNTAVTFDPIGPPSSTTLPIEERDGLVAVSCPDASQCTATSPSSEITFDPAAPGGAAPMPIGSEGPLRSIACPTLTQCTAVEFDGQEITFNPSAPGTAQARPIGISTPGSVACPSTEQCTAVGGFTAATFDPLDPTHLTLLGGPAGGFVSAIACPEATQCTIVTGNEETTFDPQTAPEPVTKTTPPTGLPPHRSLNGAKSRIGLVGTAVAVSRGRATIAIRCVGDAACAIEVTLGSSRPAATADRLAGLAVPIGAARRTIAAGHRAKIEVTLTRAGLRLLGARGGRMAAELMVNGRGGGAVIHTRRSIRLRLTTGPVRSCQRRRRGRASRGH